MGGEVSPGMDLYSLGEGAGLTPVTWNSPSVPLAAFWWGYSSRVNGSMVEGKRRASVLSFVGPDVASSSFRAKDATLVGGRAGCIIGCIDSGTIKRQRMGLCRAAIVLQGA